MAGRAGLSTPQQMTAVRLANLPSEALRGRRLVAAAATLVAFDLIELQGDDLRNDRLLERKQQLDKLLSNNSTDTAIVITNTLSMTASWCLIMPVGWALKASFRAA